MINFWLVYGLIILWHKRSKRLISSSLFCIYCINDYSFYGQCITIYWYRSYLCSQHVCDMEVGQSTDYSWIVQKEQRLLKIKLWKNRKEIELLQGYYRFQGFTMNAQDPFHIQDSKTNKVLKEVPHLQIH